MNYTILESTREIFVMIVMMKKSSNFDFILTQIEFVCLMLHLLLLLLIKEILVEVKGVRFDDKSKIYIKNILGLGC